MLARDQVVPERVEVREGGLGLGMRDRLSLEFGDTSVELGRTPLGVREALMEVGHPCRDGALSRGAGAERTALRGTARTAAFRVTAFVGAAGELTALPSLTHR